MREISIVMRAGEERLIENIRIIEPMLETMDYELIIINNKIKSLDIKHDYTLYEFSGSCSKFKEFCFAAAMGKKIVIIDGDIQLTPELAEDIKIQLSSSDFKNVLYEFRRFLSNKRPVYFKDKNVLIYNRGIKGFNTESKISIDDFTLLDGESIDVNIKKLLDKKSFNELYLWYKHSILEHLKERKQYFYELLEREKAELEEKDISAIEDLFLCCCLDEKYCTYLDIKRRLFRDGAVEPFMEMLNSLSSIEDESYYSWIIYKILKDRHDLIKAVMGINISLLQDIIRYLLGFEGFADYLYGLVKEINQAAAMDADARLSDMNLLLIRSYLGFVQSLPLDPEMKNRMIKLLDTYVDVLKLRKDSDFFEKDFLNSFKRAQEHIRAGDINSAISILKALSSEYPIFEKALLYYIQRLRYEYDCFSHILSICMIVRDEEKNLERCLSSIKPLLGSTAELVIVDTGSIDKTPEIAGKYSEKVFFYKWRGDFSAARNYSLSLAAGQYIFLLDADEEIDAGEITKLVGYFGEKYYKLYNTCTLKVKNYTDVNLEEYAVLTQPRIFRNSPEFYYSGRVHNQPVYELPVYHLPVIITHYGYIMTDDIKDKKFERTASMLKQELQKNPENIYYRFQLSTSYAMHGDLKKAIEQAEIYLRSIGEENKLDDNYMMHFNNAVILYISSGQLDKASEICDEGLKIKQDFIDFVYYKARICYETEDYENALIFTGKYLDLIDRFMSLDVANDGRYSFYTLGLKKDVIKIQLLCQHQMGDYDGTINTLENFNEADIKDCLHAIVHSYLMKKRYRDLVKFYNSSCQDETTKLVFKYFFESYAKKASLDNAPLLSGILDSLDCLGHKNDNLKNSESSGSRIDTANALLVIENYNLNSLNLYEIVELFNKLLPSYNSYDALKAADVREVFLYKKLGFNILKRTAQLNRFRGYSDEELIGILRKYMNLSSYLILNRKADLISPGEQLFLVKITEAFKRYGAGDYEGARMLLNQSLEACKPMEGIIRILQRSVFPGREEAKHPSKAVRIIKDNAEGIKTYANVVAEKLLEAAGKKSNHELLELFNQFNRKELYNQSLFSYKALLLMSEGMYREAEEELLEGLDLYKDDIKLLSSLARLYSLTHKYDKSLETYCRVKLLSRDGSRLSLSELVPEKYTSLKIDRPRVLHGTMFADNSVNKLASELIKGGVHARTISYTPKYTGYTSDYCIDMNQYKRGEDILSRTLDAATYLIPRFDIFHFHYGNTLTFDYSDLPLLYELGKKMLVQFYGDEIKNGNTVVINGKLVNLSKYIRICIVSNQDVYNLVKDYFKETYLIREGLSGRLIELYNSLD